MRVTQTMIMNSYNSRLGKVFAGMDKANQKVITQRNFLSASENPAGAARAYQLRRTMQQNDDYLTNVENIRDTLDSVDASIMVVSKMAENTYVNILEAKNGTWTPEQRQVFANELRSMQKTAVDALNAKFDDKFLFGGTSTKELPFELGVDASGNQILKYRGLSVSASANQTALNALANEKMYMDIGFGLSVDASSGKPVVADNSAFNTALPGIQFIGYGTSPEDNFILNMGKIADELERDPMNYTELNRLGDLLDKQRQSILIADTKLGSNSEFLEARIGVLERNNDNLNSKILKVEYIDLADAISDFKMADYTYRAALSMGTKILTPSFIDFMS